MEIIEVKVIRLDEGLVLPNDWQGEWGRMDAWEACWTRQEALTAPVEIWRFRGEKDA